MDDITMRDYEAEAVSRVMGAPEFEIVNGADVEVRSAVDLTAGHLDPWVVKLDKERLSGAAPERTSPLELAKTIVAFFFSRDKLLLRGRAALAALGDADDWERDLSSGQVKVTREEVELAGSLRPWWRYERPQAGSGPRPVLVHLHGGGFSAGTPNGRDPFLKLIADVSDTVVFDLDYSMIPERTVPAAVNEARAALLHLHEQAATWGLDEGRFAIGGGSAGGNIAAATALMARDCGDPPIALQVLYSPFLSFGGKQAGLEFRPVDVAPEHAAFAGPQQDPMRGFLVRLLYHAYRGKGRRKDPYLSPAHATDLAGVAPALIFTAEMDPLHQSAEHYAGELTKAGVPTRTIRLRGAKHDTVVQVGRVPYAEAAALATAAALSEMGAESTRGQGIET
jgi:acetyl esterase/lipase